MFVEPKVIRKKKHNECVACSSVLVIIRFSEVHIRLRDEITPSPWLPACSHNSCWTFKL